MEQTKRFSKRLLAVMLSLAMVFSLVQGGIFTASAAETSGDFWYRVLVDGTVEITGYSGSATELTIPSTIDGKTVTSIGEEAFFGCDSLTSVTIGNSVKNIGDYAFNCCYGLTSIEIPNSVKSIGDCAFSYCESLTSIEIPNSVKSIGDYAFYCCRSLTNFEISTSVESIGDYTFCYCESLTSIDVADGNNYYSDIDGVLFNKDITALIQYPIGKTDTSYTIPDSVENIGEGAFYYCGALESIHVSENNANYSDIDGVLFNKDKTELIQYPIGKTDASYTIPTSVKSIGDYAFSYCDKLTSIEIPDSVKSIGDYAFSYCDKLTSIEIPDSVKSVGEGAFYYCGALESIEIPTSVESIGDYAFYYCKSLSSIEIPDSVKLLGKSAFYGTRLYENEENWENDVLYIDEYLIKGKNNITGEIRIKDGTKLIANEAFYNCRSLTSIEIPNSVESIGEEAFDYCYALTRVDIPDSVNIIGDYAFYNCLSLESIDIAEENDNYSDIDGVLFNKDITALIQYPIGKTNTSYTIPDSVESVVSCAFSDCTLLTSVTIGNSVESIGEKAFEDCDSLTAVNYVGTREQWNQIIIGEYNESLTNATITFCQHTNTEIDNAVPPTCEKTGLTAGSHCKDCGAKIKAQTVVKAKGHTTAVKNKKSATYFAKGYSGDTVCKTCNKVVKKGKATAKKTLKTPKVKVTKGKKQFKVKYNKVSGATGFEVQYKIGKKAVTKSFNTKKSATKNIIKLKKGNYKVKVRAFVKSGKKKAYSKWTKTYKVKVN